MSGVEEMLVALGGNAALLIILGFLARSLMQTLLAKDIKKFETDLQSTAASQLEHLKSDLKAKGDISIEQLKSRLQQATIEYQVRFAKLHEKRAEVIAEIYGLLVDAEQTGRRFATVEGFMAGTEEQREAREKTQSTMFAVSLFIEKHLLYLPEQMRGSLKQHLDNMFRHVFGVGAYGSFHALTPEKQLEQQMVFTAACKAFEQEIPAARRALEDEFRKMLDAPLSDGAT